MTNRAPIMKRRKRFDALLGLPLERFRRELTELSAEELTALEERIAVQTMRQRWSLGGHGMERHRAHGELALLERRRLATNLEHKTRESSAVDTRRLVELEPNLVILPASSPNERAA